MGIGALKTIPFVINGSCLSNYGQDTLTITNMPWTDSPVTRNLSRSFITLHGQLGHEGTQHNQDDVLHGTISLTKGYVWL